jgi:hypothetical protein
MNPDGPATPEPAAATTRRGLLGKALASGLLSKSLISLFVVMNILAILRSNRPSWAGHAVESTAESAFGPLAVYRLRYTGWLIDRYAHLSGLNNRWEMFSHQSRFNWWYGIQGVTPDGTVVELNLPLVGERTFAERNFFDFREAKYHLNLYPNPDLRHRYGRYLCRALARVRVPDHGRVQQIRFLLHHQNLLSPEEARARGTHIEPNVYSRSLDEVSCLPRG